MTDGGGEMTGLERLALTGALVVIAVLIGVDAVQDWRWGGSPGHVGLELAVMAAAAAGAAVLIARYVTLRSRLAATQATLARVRQEADGWRRQNEALLRGLSAAIDRQLDAWRLTTSEKEVAFLLLKGLSFREVAAVRGTSERTVRQQALSVYAKSGLGGRAELAAFFLEDLLVPASEDARAGSGRVAP